MHQNKRSKGDSVQRTKGCKHFFDVKTWKAVNKSKSYKDVYGRTPRRRRERGL